MNDNEITIQIESIKYGHTLIDRGYVLGYRRYMSDAGRRKFPLWARIGRDWVSQYVFRKSAGHTFYVPVSCFKKGKTIIMYDRKKMQKPVKYKVLQVDANVVNLKLMN